MKGRFTFFLVFLVFGFHAPPQWEVLQRVDVVHLSAIGSVLLASIFNNGRTRKSAILLFNLNTCLVRRIYPYRTIHSFYSILQCAHTAKTKKSAEP
jgi:hypothetical protein